MKCEEANLSSKRSPRHLRARRWNLNVEEGNGGLDCRAWVAAPGLKHEIVSFGLRWEECSPSGTELKNDLVSKALRYSTFFTIEQFLAFEFVNLKKSHFIRVASVCFKPV